MARFAGAVRLVGAALWLGLAVACGGSGNGGQDALAEAPDEVAEVAHEAESTQEVGPEAEALAEAEWGAEAEAPGEVEPVPESAEEVEPQDSTPESETATDVHVVLNEVVAKAVNLGPDWLELVNLGASAVDLSGWVLKDDNDAHSFTLPQGVTLEAGAYLLVEGEGGSGPLVMGYGFGKADSVRLFDAGGALVDTTTWLDGDAPMGGSWGRFPNGTGAFTTLATPTPGAVNTDQ
jgi:hypothetical protein